MPGAELGKGRTFGANSQLKPSGNEKTKLPLVHEIQARALCRETELLDGELLETVARLAKFRRECAFQYLVIPMGSLAGIAIGFHPAPLRAALSIYDTSTK